MVRLLGLLSVLLVVTPLVVVASQCPHLSGLASSSSSSSFGAPAYASASHHSWMRGVSPRRALEHARAVEALDWYAVKADIVKTLHTSQDFWPADLGHYGPFMIRHAWHCAGSYRIFDGNGGCDGGRQRFEPERSWDDNTNLDKAKHILLPIKLKYGNALSWGDLIILTGTTAIETMGGPVLGFCAGRIDDADGTDSLGLGPTEIQAADYPCPVNGKCTSPLGATTVGLIYVNPEGPMGVPDPALSAPQVRDTFGRMAMDDFETVALIGGGHAFGKTHGACDKPNGAGPSPKEDPTNPWPGLCGTGKGTDAWTSGFEGAWTLTPHNWTNDYFHTLLNNQNNFEKVIGKGGHNQWKVVNATDGLMMLTSDISLLHDPLGKYIDIVKHYAANFSQFEDAFARAWYKLTTRDMGPISRCLGPLTPPVQPFQYPLPEPSSINVDITAVKALIKTALTKTSTDLDPDTYDSKSYYGALFTDLAYQCSATYRRTDYLGGCNGARIRFEPQASWPVNKGLDLVLKVLKPILDATKGLTWADLIVIAGQVAIEEASGLSLSFCGGRTDASDGLGSELLQPTLNGSAGAHALKVRMNLMGLTSREFVALSGRMRSPTQQKRLGFTGSYTANPTVLNNEFFNVLLSETWVASTSAAGHPEYKAVGKDLYLTPADMQVKWEADWMAIAQEYAANNTVFVGEFTRAWTKLVNSDRFDGPLGNKCSVSPSPSPSPDTSSSGLSSPVVAAISVGATLLVAIVVYQLCLKPKAHDSERLLSPTGHT